MKALRTLPILLLFCGISVALAQQVTEGPRPFIKKTSGNSLSIIYTGQPANVEAVLQKWISEASGQRGSSKSGFKAWEGVRIQAFSPNTLDYYLSVDKLSRQDKENSEATFFISAGNENFLSTGSNPEIINEVKSWLESMQKEITIYELQLAIEAQEKVIEKSLKEEDGLQKDSVRLQTTLAETLAAIEQNKASNINQRANTASERDRLMAFREELDLVQRGPQEAIMRTETETEAIIEDVTPAPTPASGGSGGNN